MSESSFPQLAGAQLSTTIVQKSASLPILHIYTLNLLMIAI